MAFSPRNILGCLLKKGLQRGGGGVTGTPGPPSLRPWPVVCVTHLRYFRLCHGIAAIDCTTMSAYIEFSFVTHVISKMFQVVARLIFHVTRIWTFVACPALSVFLVLLYLPRTLPLQCFQYVPHFAQFKNGNKTVVLVQCYAPDAEDLYNNLSSTLAGF